MPGLRRPARGGCIAGDDGFPDMKTTGDMMRRARRRSWHRTIAAKLLIAFATITALTAIAALVAVLQFGHIEAAMERLTGFSLPAVKYSLAVENNARAVAAGGAQLAGATSETQRFTYMSESTERIGNLWGALSQLRAATGESDSIVRLQALIAAIDGRLGQLDRAIREKIAVTSTLDGVMARIARESESLADRLLRLPPQAQAAANGLRADTYRAVGLLYLGASTLTPATVLDSQKQFDVLRERIAASLQILAKDSSADPAQADEIGSSGQTLLALGTGSGGVFALRSAELAQRQAADELQAALQKSRGGYGGTGRSIGVARGAGGRQHHGADRRRAR